MDHPFQTAIHEAIRLKQQLLDDPLFRFQTDQLISRCVGTFRKGNKVLFCGNGGSAADAQHLAAELSGRFYRDRPPLPSEALHVNTSYLTAVANDYSFEEVYARMVTAMGKPGDMLIALSTSGRSQNILKAITAAHTTGMYVVGWTGSSGGLMEGQCDLLFKIPSEDTPRIQECHMLIGHILCAAIEDKLFPLP